MIHLLWLCDKGRHRSFWAALLTYVLARLKGYDVGLRTWHTQKNSNDLKPGPECDCLDKAGFKKDLGLGIEEY